MKMGGVNSSVQISEMMQKIYQTINNQTENISTNETVNKLKSEIIQNYVQNLTQRVINKRTTETNLKNNIEAAIKVNQTNEIAYETVRITGNEETVSIEQANVSAEKIASSLQEFAEDVYQSILAGTNEDNFKMNAELCQSDETFNQAAQDAISAVTSDTTSNANQTDKQDNEIKEESGGIDLKSLFKVFEGNSNYQKTIQDLDIQTNINNLIKNVMTISVLNDKSIVQQLNSSLNKLFETINETVSTVNKITESKASTEVNQSNIMKGSSLDISNNKQTVSISQLNKSRNEAIASVFISSLTSSDIDSKSAAIMSDIMGITTDNSSKSASIIDQSIAATSGATSSSSSIQDSQKKSVIIATSSGIIGTIVIILVIIFIYKKVHGKKSKENKSKDKQDKKSKDKKQEDKSKEDK